MWDDIIEDSADSNLDIKGLVSEYHVADVHKQLRNRNITLSFGWDVMPNVGVLKLGPGPNPTEQAQKSVTILTPKQYK